MSDSEEDEEDMPDDKNSTCSGEADGDPNKEDDVVVAEAVVADVDRDGDGGTRGEDEDSPDDFFDAGEGAVIAGDASSYAQPPRVARVAALVAPKTTPSAP